LQRVGPNGLPPGPPAGAPSGGSTGLALKGAGLVAIAVVAGLVWYLIRHTDAPDAAQPPATPAGADFTLAQGPVVAGDCVKYSYDKTKKFFSDNNCTRLARALYTTTSGGSPVLLSVVLVTMPDAAKAQALKALTDQDKTGNVTDLVKDGTYKAPGGLKLATGTYKAGVTGSEVTIVLSQFLDQHEDKPALLKVDTDALKLASKLR
jgi:hypothetical protein